MTQPQINLSNRAPFPNAGGGSPGVMYVATLTWPDGQIVVTTASDLELQEIEQLLAEHPRLSSFRRALRWMHQSYPPAAAEVVIGDGVLMVKQGQADYIQIPPHLRRTGYN